MTASVHTQRLQGIAALVMLGAVVGFLVWSALGPVLELRRSISDTRNRIDKFTAATRAVDGRNIDTRMVIATGEAIEARSLAVQRTLVDDTSAAGLRLRQLSASPAHEFERGLVRLSYEMDMSGDLEHWTTFLRSLGDRRPALFVDRMIVRTGPGARPDFNLSMQMTVTAYVLRPVANP